MTANAVLSPRFAADSHHSKGMEVPFNTMGECFFLFFAVWKESLSLVSLDLTGGSRTKGMGTGTKLNSALFSLCLRRCVLKGKDGVLFADCGRRLVFLLIGFVLVLVDEVDVVDEQ
jgi:hypothetical protein